MSAFRQLLKSEIIGATITALFPSNISCAIELPAGLMSEADLLENERVQIWHSSSGRVIDAYVRSSQSESDGVSLFGVYAPFIKTGDEIHITAFMYISEINAPSHELRRIYVDASNRVVSAPMEGRGPLFYSIQKTV